MKKDVSGCADGAQQCPGEDCALWNHLHTTDGTLLLAGKHIQINQHPWNGFWVLDQLLQHFYIWWYCCMSWCNPRLHPLHSFSLDQEDFVLHVHPVPCLAIATSSDMGGHLSRCNYTRRCTTVTKGNSTQKASTEPAWCKTSQHDLFLQSPFCCTAPPLSWA